MTVLESTKEFQHMLQPAVPTTPCNSAGTSLALGTVASEDAAIATDSAAAAAGAGEIGFP